MSHPKRSLAIRVVVMPSEGQFLAQGLEYDLAAQGGTHDQAVESFVRILRARLRADITRGLQPLGNLPAAPDQFFDMWDRWQAEAGEHKLSAESVGDGNIPPAFVITQLAHASGSGLSN